MSDSDPEVETMHLVDDDAVSLDSNDSGGSDDSDSLAPLSIGTDDNSGDSDSVDKGAWIPPEKRVQRYMQKKFVRFRRSAVEKMPELEAVHEAATKMKMSRLRRRQEQEHREAVFQGVACVIPRLKRR